MREARPAIAVGALLLSVAAHATWVWHLAQQPPRARQDARSEPLQLELVRIAPAPEASAEQPARAARPESAASKERVARRSAAVRAANSQPEQPARSEPLSAFAGGASVAAPAPPRSAAVVPGPSAAAPDLSPAAAASTLADALLALPPNDAGARARSCRAAFADAGVCEGDLERESGERLQHALSEAATRIPHLAPRPPPLLKHGVDGSYRFEGTVFTALIRPDGSVSLVDRPPVTVGPIPISGGFDLMDTIEKYVLGKEIYSSEKRWFLDETAELRRTLSDADRARSLARGSLRLRGQLESILASSGVPDPRKREQIFELWDDCAPDDLGAQAQRIVERFVRERLPLGSALAYPAEELASLNRRRVSPHPFAPYDDPVDAGSPG